MSTQQGAQQDAVDEQQSRTEAQFSAARSQQQIIDALYELRHRLNQLESSATPGTETDSPVLPPLAPPVPAVRSTYTKPRLPNPPQFEDSKSEYPIWKRKMSAKLAIDSDFIGTDAPSRANYVLAYLSGEAAKYADHFVSKVNTQGEALTPEALFQHLDSRYDDPHVKQQALDEYGRKKMGNTPFPEFISEMERLMSEAGIDHWDDEAKVFSVSSKLSNEMQQLSVGPIATLRPKTWDEHKSLWHSLWNQYSSAKLNGVYKYTLSGARAASAQQSKRKTRSQSPPVQMQVSGQTDDRMDWTHTNRAGTQDNRPKADRVGRKELDARKAAGVCITCGNKGHWAAQCYYAPPVRYTKINRTAAPPQQKRLTAGGDSSDGESENE